MTNTPDSRPHGLILRALILAGLIIFGIFLLAERGLLGLALDSDRSYISYVILLLYAGLSAQWFYLVLEMSRSQSALTRTRARLNGAARGAIVLREGEVQIDGATLEPGFFADHLHDLLARHSRDGSVDQQVLLEALGERLVARHGFGNFAADALLKLGLLGTIIGFIMMLAPVAELRDFDPSILQQMLGKMSGGMAVALFTTIAGLVTSTLLALQYELLGNAAVNFLNLVARTAEVMVLPMLGEPEQDDGVA